MEVHAKGQAAGRVDSPSKFAKYCPMLTPVPVIVVSEEESIYRQTLAFEEEVMKVRGTHESVNETSWCAAELEVYLVELKIPAEDYCVSDQVEPCWNVLLHLAERRFDREFVKWILAFLQRKDPKFQVSLSIQHPKAGQRVSGSLLEISLHRPWVAARESLPLMIERHIAEPDGKTIRPGLLP